MQTLRILVRIQLSPRAIERSRQILYHQDQHAHAQGKSVATAQSYEGVLQELIFADLIYFDNNVPFIFHEDADAGDSGIVCRNIDPPSVRYLPDPNAAGCVLAFIAPRSLPISSAHGGRECLSLSSSSSISVTASQAPSSYPF